MARLSLPQSLAPNSQPPSRHNNPFATCWTRPGAMAFRFGNGQTATDFVGRLAAQRWQGAIIGPHGCGKSTLLETLKPALLAADRHIHATVLHDGQRRLPPNTFKNWQSSKTIVIVDGYEQLGWFERMRLVRHCRRTNVGLLVTSHRRIQIPTLVRLEPDRDLALHLVNSLCSRVSTPVTPSDVFASHACHGSNIREILFDMYDRHERIRGRDVER